MQDEAQKSAISRGCIKKKKNEAERGLCKDFCSCSEERCSLSYKTNKRTQTLNETRFFSFTRSVFTRVFLIIRKISISIHSSLVCLQALCSAAKSTFQMFHNSMVLFSTTPNFNISTPLRILRHIFRPRSNTKTFFFLFFNSVK